MFKTFFRILVSIPTSSEMLGEPWYPYNKLTLANYKLNIELLLERYMHSTLIVSLKIKLSVKGNSNKLPYRFKRKKIFCSKIKL